MVRLYKLSYSDRSDLFHEVLRFVELIVKSMQRIRLMQRNNGHVMEIIDEIEELLISVEQLQRVLR